MLLTIIVLSLLVTPFVYCRFTSDLDNVKVGYASYSITTQSDYELMTWMGTNLPSDAVILVHPFGSGTFIPSISHLKIIFPFTQSCTSQSYEELVNLIGDNILNATTYQLLNYWNISYIFVGSTEAHSSALFESGFSPWSPQVFLGNPNFILVKNFGDSYLFKVNVTNQDTAFLDNFEYNSWNQNLWEFNSTDNGLGNATITPGTGVDGSNSLTITAQATPEIGGFSAEYACWVNRTIFLPNNSNTTFSFYVNATKGFSGKDTFALLISDTNQSQALVITTPNSIYQNYSNAIILDSYNGSFTFNLSEKWLQTYNSTLPIALVLTLEVINFDSVQSVVNIDNLNFTTDN